MANRTLNLSPDLYDYLLTHSVREHEVMKELRERTAKIPGGHMQIAPEQAQFMQLLVQLTGAQHVLEIGTFTGYSALAMALALPDDGTVTCCEINTGTIAIGQTYWEKANLSHKMIHMPELAIKSLQKLLDNGKEGYFDMAFIDADKVNYLTYYEQCLKLVRTGGLVMIDNVFWDGRVSDTSNDEFATTVIRELNQKVHEDERVSISIVPIGDGLTLALKR